MRIKLYLAFLIFLTIFCLNLIIYTKKLEKLNEVYLDADANKKINKRFHRFKDNSTTFKAKCNCHNFSINFQLNENTNKYKISKQFYNSSNISLYEISKEVLDSSLLTCDKFNSLKRGPFQKIISYSLYGKSTKFYENIREIIDSATKYFPDWSIRIYHDGSIHKQTICQFECYENKRNQLIVDFCNIEELNIDLNGMYWRLFPLGIYFKIRF